MSAARNLREPALPLTYAAYLAYVLDHHIRTGQVPPVRVQVRKRGVMFCGRVLEASPAGEGHETDWFRVDCYLGQHWFPDANVRMCSGDGRCICEPDGERGRACATVAPAGAMSPLVTRGQQPGQGA